MGVCLKMAAHLASGRVNVALLREAARRELVELLDKCIGTKVQLCSGVRVLSVRIILRFGRTVKMNMACNRLTIADWRYPVAVF